MRMMFGRPALLNACPPTSAAAHREREPWPDQNMLAIQASGAPSFSESGNSLHTAGREARRFKNAAGPVAQSYHDAPAGGFHGAAAAAAQPVLDPEWQQSAPLGEQGQGHGSEVTSLAFGKRSQAGMVGSTNFYAPSAWLPQLEGDMKSHRRPASESEVLVPRSGIPAQPFCKEESMDLDLDTAPEHTQSRLCSDHRDEPLKLYCTVCKVFICYECLASTHKNEDGTTHETVALKATLDKHRAVIGQMATELQEDLVSRLCNATHHVSEVMSSLDHYAVAAKASISAHVQHLAGMLEGYWLNQVDELVQYRRKLLQDQHSELQSQLSTVCNVLEDCQRTLMPTTETPSMVSFCEAVQQRLCDIKEMHVNEQACQSDAVIWTPSKPLDPVSLAGGTLRTQAAFGPFCVATGAGTMQATKDQEATFLLEAFDRFGQRMTSGGDCIESFWLEGRQKRDPPPDVVIVDHKDGSYTLSYTFTTQRPGIYQLRVVVNGFDIVASPFSINRDHWGLTPVATTTDVRIVGSRQAVSRSGNQYAVGNRGFSVGKHYWKAEFQGGRLSVGVVGAIDPSSGETVDEIQRRSWSWCRGMTYEGPDKEPASSTTNFDYAQVVYLTLDCGEHMLSISTQPPDIVDGKQDKLCGLPSIELFPLFGLRHGGNKVLVESL